MADRVIQDIYKVIITQGKIFSGSLDMNYWTVVINVEWTSSLFISDWLCFGSNVRQIRMEWWLILKNHNAII